MSEDKALQFAEKEAELNQEHSIGCDQDQHVDLPLFLDQQEQVCGQAS
jgi:dsDNA-binding SOS-regulon protein